MTARESETRGRASEGAPAPSNAFQVLAVDDDPASLELIVGLLEGPEFDVVTARDGREAWHTLESQPDRFDVVITDRKMPRMSGLELLARIKRHQTLASVPVIMETAVADRRDIVEGIEAGAYHYLTKPLDGAMLACMVRAAAAEYARIRELRLEVTKDAGVLGRMLSARFEFRTPEEAVDLGAFLAKACPQPERVVVGLGELLMNAVEHGNLAISYDEKTELNHRAFWFEEVHRRLARPEYADRRATALFERLEDRVRFTIRDDGEGFDPTPYLQIDPSRVFDSHGRGIAMANLLSFDHLEYRRGGSEVVATLMLTGA